jgi:hypothetical protein
LLEHDFEGHVASAKRVRQLIRNPLPSETRGTLRNDLGEALILEQTLTADKT